MVSDMEIYYTNETLYVNIDEIVDEFSIIKLRRRLFRILEDYGITNVELNVFGHDAISKNLLLDLLKESNRKYHTNIKLK